MAEHVTFSFGENWKRYLQESYSEEALLEATRSLTEFFGTEGLRDRSFLDIGCGSGMFSLAAHRLGASVMSMDIDPQSVECTRLLCSREGKPQSWTVMQGSILDDAFLRHVRKADVVYSWGVLHHTGNMWKAIENAGTLVKPGGMLVVAIYNRADGLFGSRFWLHTKRVYNHLPTPGKRVVEWGYFGTFVACCLVTLRNPFRKIRAYRGRRGMNWWSDARDWLGGLPYEYAGVDEVVLFMKIRGFEAAKVHRARYTANNQFLFRKK